MLPQNDLQNQCNLYQNFIDSLGWGVSQVEEGFSSKCKDLSSNPSTTKKKKKSDWPFMHEWKTRP
jgi:hypothetical protein